MNGLSWFLYLAEVIPKFSGVGLFAVFVALIVMFAYPPKGVKIFSNNHVPFSGAKIWWAWVVVVLGVVLMTVTPSKETIYLIAGSQAGEYVVTSPEGQEIINDIKEIIKSQIEGLK